MFLKNYFTYHTCDYLAKTTTRIFTVTLCETKLASKYQVSGHQLDLHVQCEVISKISPLDTGLFLGGPHHVGTPPRRALQRAGRGEQPRMAGSDMFALVLLGYGESHNYACMKYGCCNGKQHVT